MIIMIRSGCFRSASAGNINRLLSKSPMPNCLNQAAAGPGSLVQVGCADFGLISSQIPADMPRSRACAWVDYRISDSHQLARLVL